MTRLPLTLVGLVSLGGLTACSMDDSPYKKTEYSMASNPAAVYCVQQDGKLETITENSQRVTYCVLPDGKKVEQWEYYLERHHQEKDDQ
ncbi:DUF333 domain-containing protein [Vibrio taketomensis]|uniref:putative hemolysin n=1 Tax=Vibrio taketomensis TaxID=2572923 RepID=UPI0013897E71|nr:DUF333 domain-containing protein [Vibrio taketomensis]